MIAALGLWSHFDDEHHRQDAPTDLFALVKRLPDRWNCPMGHEAMPDAIVRHFIAMTPSGKRLGIAIDALLGHRNEAQELAFQNFLREQLWPLTVRECYQHYCGSRAIESKAARPRARGLSERRRKMLRRFSRVARQIFRFSAFEDAARIPASNESASSVLAKLFDQKRAVVVVVGSNDGVQGDSLAHLIRTHAKWQVLFIEPLPHLFRKLTQNYAPSPNYQFENIAVSAKKELRELWYVSEEIKKWREDLPFWYDQLGSFDRNHIASANMGFEEFITSEFVPCEPLPEILRRNDITKIDILQIDTEGYDYEVLKQVDLKTNPPAAILYEHTLLRMEDQIAAGRLLLRAGYHLTTVTTVHENSDTLAIHAQLLSKRSRKTCRVSEDLHFPAEAETENPALSVIRTKRAYSAES